MDSTRSSLSSKALHITSGGGNESQMEEGPQRDSVDGESRRGSESRETDVLNGMTAAAEVTHHHRGSADKQKFNTLGFKRRTKQKVVTDFATLSKGSSGGAKPRTALRQVLFSQGVSDKNPATEERGQLDVLKQDLEALQVPVNLRWRWKEESQGTTLEKNWTDIVQSHSTMSKMQRHQQEALWEFVHTELTYINKLIIIKDLVIAALVNLHQHGFLLEVTAKQLFSNLPSILTAHQLFWQEVIFPMLQEVRRTGKPFDPMKLEAGCLQFHERFLSYHNYCWEEEDNLEFTRWQMENNPHFVTFVQWVETHPQCERMRLGDMQAKPHQRITKYPLLLKAVLKTTQDPHVQNILRGMLSSVNSFLESINDYLRVMDERLALSISAQRVEGYEVEGINEEIDKHVREICRFDLTCPIREVGCDVVRKLLLEENLKIRDRKDSKLEVMVLLFSDVLLITKVPKKGERLKMVRPPLVLDRTSCIALKDSCSFVLVEVGELQSAMNVYIFAASTSERCSTWVSNIHQAKETLEKLRETESNRQQENWKIQWEAKSVEEAKLDDMDTEEGGKFVDNLSEELIIPRAMNGMLASKEAKGQYHPADHVAINNMPTNSNHKFVLKSVPGRSQTVKGYEWIEMGVRRDQDGSHTEEEKIVESQMTNERNHRAQSVPNLNFFIHNTAADPLRYNTTRPHSLLIDRLPDVDYPTNNDSTTQLPYQPAMSREGPERLPGGGVPSLTDSQSVDHNTRRNSSCSQSVDEETSPETLGFSKDLRSPRLHRRRPVIHKGSFPHMSQQRSVESWAVSNNSDSDYSLNLKKNSLPCSQSSDSHRVLKLGSLKPNQGMFWYMNDRVSPDPQTLSEPELADPNFHRKVMKTQRSASIPNIIIEGDHGFHPHHSRVYTLPQAQDTPFPISERHPNGQNSPLAGLLERAKERVKDRDGIKRGRDVKVANLWSRHLSPSPTFSTTPSPLPSDGDKDTDWEEEVKLMRHRAPTVSKGWKEQLVDGDENDNDSSYFTEGVNVDWPGWCFDDDEVMNRLYPENEGLLESINRSLALSDVSEMSEDGECSQV